MPIFNIDSMIQYPSLSKAPPNETIKKINSNKQDCPKFEDKKLQLKQTKEQKEKKAIYISSPQDLLVIGDNNDQDTNDQGTKDQDTKDQDTKDQEESEEEMEEGEEVEKDEEDSTIIANSLLPKFRKLSESLSDLSANSN